MVLSKKYIKNGIPERNYRLNNLIKQRGKIMKRILLSIIMIGLLSVTLFAEEKIIKVAAEEWVRNNI